MTADLSLPICARLSPDEFRSLTELGSPLRLAAGEQMSGNGDLADNFYVLLHGELRVVQQGEREQRLLACQPDDPPLLIGAPFLVSVEAVRDSQLIQIGAEAYLRQVSATSPANNLLVSGLVWRLRGAETRVHSSQKMAALGRMSAGLTHELNNPAAATARAAGQLREALRELHSLTLQLSEHKLAPAQVETLAALQQQAVDRAAVARLDPLTRGDREEEMSAWLEEQGVEESWELAPRLVAGGLDRREVEALAAALPREALTSALGWVAGVIAVGDLLQVVEQSAARISELVLAVKSYTYMDRGPLQEVSVHDGLESTLIILGHKLQDVEVLRDYAPDLPPVMAYGAELNQVWTNLLDNAADALGQQGHIWLRTWQEGRQVVVEIADDGPGIPAAVREHLFTGHVTTKKPGQGTGLGLGIVYQIIVERHSGDIQVSSAPGDTRFRVYLPIEQESAKEAAEH